VTPDERQTPGQSASRPIAGNAAERIATIIEAAERAAAAVVDSADANARRYLEEAQAEADRIVAARLSSFSELTDSLVAQAEEVRRQSERLLESLARANSQLETPVREAAPPAPPAVAPPPPVAGEREGRAHLTAVSPPPAPVSPPPSPPVEQQRQQPPSAEPAPPPQPEQRLPSAPPPVEGDAGLAPPERPSVAEDQSAAAGARLLATQMAVSGSSREEIETRLRTGFEIEDTASILDAILGPKG
jgi:hypothetical protein